MCIVGIFLMCFLIMLLGSAVVKSFGDVSDVRMTNIILACYMKLFSKRISMQVMKHSIKRSVIHVKT